MARFGRLPAIWQSFYSRNLYCDVAFRWQGTGLLYLLLLLAVTWLPTPARWARGLSAFADRSAPHLAQELPAIAIENGVMRADPPGRHVVHDPDQPGKVMLIVDDTIDEVPPGLDTQMMFLARREFGVIRPSRGERRVFRMSETASFSATPAGVTRFLRSLAFWLPPVGYIAVVAGSLLMRLLQALLYAAIGQVFARKASVELDYQALMRISAVAMTPVIVARTLLWFGPWDPVWYLRWPTAFAITLMYLRFGIQSAAAEKAAAPGAVVA